VQPKSIVLALSALCLPLSGVGAPAPAQAAEQNRSFHVDCAAADGGDGSQADPWNTLAPVNARTFRPGDSILLKRGSTCTAQQLHPKGSGTEGRPITIDAYGSGAKPKLAGAGQVTDVVRLADQQYWEIRNLDISNNEVSGGKSECDGQGLDIDEANTGTVYQYNYSHDNEGGFILLCNGSGSTSADNVVRYNISQNDGGQLFDMVCARTSNTQIHNNTFYLSEPVDIVNNANGSTGADVAFSNNIFHVATPEAAYVNAGSLAFDSNKLTADPELTAPGTATSRTDTDGYRLRAGSPALANGKVMASPGTRDYFGNQVTAGCVPDRGAHQLSTSCTTPPAPVPAGKHENG
jgi:hypothetical protein